MKPKLLLGLALVLGGGLLVGCCTASNSPGRMSASQPDCIRLSGEFKKPGCIPWTNGMTLKDAITSGELTDFARHQILIKHADGTRDQYRWGSLQKSLFVVAAVCDRRVFEPIHILRRSQSAATGFFAEISDGVHKNNCQRIILF